ncbi:hypothetical protein PILCRDRAFT_818144 [Piloderma croceum F 1598]|uniref:FMN-dependent dehydrogenase domain-containing protein n=1 Tax=Piloderma croceum (strain F 1598) TaxID=765440 RepID=A0A0C3C4K8_PILCF|nr:hypothetical protein PILCRDRAFT_818144 [Piloderma croceum F 1598]
MAACGLYDISTGPTIENAVCRLYLKVQNRPSVLDAFNLKSLPHRPQRDKNSHRPPKTCLNLGFRAIYVSNHSGCVLDGAPTLVKILLRIRKNDPEVFDKMAVYADGGLRRGNGGIVGPRLWVLNGVRCM